MTTITPTPGRVVWFYPTKAEQDQRFPNMPAPYAAHVCYVNDDRNVNLLVITPNGHTESRLNVYLVQPGDADQSGDVEYCSWMPYQVGQAAKNSQPASLN
jgi:hypothetical protein